MQNPGSDAGVFVFGEEFSTSVRAIGSRNARPMAGSAKQSGMQRRKSWIASSQELLAMTG
jgi:hypothetical protein